MGALGDYDIRSAAIRVAERNLNDEAVEVDTDIGETYTDVDGVWVRAWVLVDYETARSEAER